MGDSCPVCGKRMRRLIDHKDEKVKVECPGCGTRFTFSKGELGDDDESVVRA